MKRKRYIYLLLAVLFFVPELSAQDQGLKNLKENLVISTDRNLYVVGEKIHFSTGIVNRSEDREDLSKIIYVELVIMFTINDVPG